MPKRIDPVPESELPPEVRSYPIDPETGRRIHPETGELLSRNGKRLQGAARRVVGRPLTDAERALAAARKPKPASSTLDSQQRREERVDDPDTVRVVNPTDNPPPYKTHEQIMREAEERRGSPAKPRLPTKPKPKRYYKAHGWRTAFLTALSHCNNITAAAEAAGVSRTAVLKARKQDPQFRAKFEEAVQAAVDRAEYLAWKLAVEGQEEPVYYQGVQVGTKTVRSERMLEMILKAERPEKYASDVRAAQINQQTVANLTEARAAQLEAARENVLRLVPARADTTPDAVPVTDDEVIDVEPVEDDAADG